MPLTEMLRAHVTALAKVVTVDEVLASVVGRIDIDNVCLNTASTKVLESIKVIGNGDRIRTGASAFDDVPFNPSFSVRLGSSLIFARPCESEEGFGV